MMIKKLPCRTALMLLPFTVQTAHAGSLPGMRGADYLGITVPNRDDAVTFFAKVIGCEASFSLGAFKFNDD